MSIAWQYPSADGRVDAVIVDYGTPGLAARCLASIEDDPRFASIAVVDAKALGWSYARSVNTALRAGSAEIVLALNADTRMLEPPDAVLELFDFDPPIAVVGPRQVTSDGRITHGGIFGTNKHPEFRCWMEPLLGHDGATADTRDAITVPGSVYFARRSIWDALGGFLPTSHFYEETALSYAARHAGYRVVYTGSTTWIHEFNQSPTTPGWRAEVARQSHAMFREFCRERGIACD